MIAAIITGCKKEGPPKLSLPVLTTNAYTDITPFSAICGGDITSSGGEDFLVTSSGALRTSRNK
jgi:hypothetical protein